MTDSNNEELRKEDMKPSKTLLYLVFLFILSFGSILVYFVIGNLSGSLSLFGASLPDCSAIESKKLIEKIANDMPLMKSENIQFVELKNTKETGFNKDQELRSCTGNLVTTASQVEINYSIKWQEKESGKFYIEMRFPQQTQFSDVAHNVAKDAENQYLIAKRNGSKIDRCAQAQAALASYLLANDEESYKKWKSIQTEECSTQSEPTPHADGFSEKIAENSLEVKPSFDCSKASTQTENAICSDEILAKLERDNFEAYKKAKLSNQEKSKIILKDSLIERNKCNGDKSCIADSLKQSKEKYLQIN